MPLFSLALIGAAGLSLASLGTSGSALKPSERICPPGQYLNEYVIQDYARNSGLSVCGIRYMEEDAMVGQLPHTVSENVWHEPNFDDSAWAPGGLPFAGLHGCNAELEAKGVRGQHYTFWEPSTTSGWQSHLFSRGFFNLASNAWSKSMGAVVEFMVGSDLINVRLNGHSVLESPVSRAETCDGISTEQIISIEPEKLLPSKNTIAIHARNNGNKAYLNYRVILKVCEEFDRLATTRCTKQLLPAGPCMNSGDCDMYSCSRKDMCEEREALVADVSGECVCSISPGLMCPSISMFGDDTCREKELCELLHEVSCGATEKQCPTDPHRRS
mmetsp:Transcript_6360/g.16965  ORF Transcript_6360/g.16965 Transcript_6360/m.16965 type:complete len:329 (+) Transcript_6360:217-1203(+)